jgi:hypothetical protein
MDNNYFLLLSGDTILGAGSQPVTQLQDKYTTDTTTGKTTTTSVEVPKPLPKNCIACTQAQAETWQTLEVVDGVIQAIPATALLSTAQLKQRLTIKQSFLQASTANVTDSSGVIWEGGMASGNSIFPGCQLAQQAGAASITLYDAAKAPHSMTVAEGMGVAALIGAAYQTALGKKNTLYASIAAAKTVSAVQKIVW